MVCHIKFAVREPLGEDLPFIMDSWLGSARHCKELHGIAGEAFYRGPVKQAMYLRLSAGKLLIACDVEDPQTIFGWVLWQGNTLHWVYVKQAFRALGIASEMISALPVGAYSLSSWKGKPGKKSHWKYQPWEFWT